MKIRELVQKNSIILLLVAGVVFFVVGLLLKPYDVRSNETDASFYAMLNIDKLCFGFYMENGRFPKQEDWVNELREFAKAPAFLDTDLNNLDFVDGWGNHLIYRCPGSDIKDEYDLYSCGPDGNDDLGLNDDMRAKDESFPLYLGGHAFSDQRNRILQLSK